VDDAIVEIENIVRHMRNGQELLSSGHRCGWTRNRPGGGGDVATIIAVFLPVSFMSGVSGQYFKQFGLTVAAAVFISLMVALASSLRYWLPTRLRSRLPRRTTMPTGRIMTRYLRMLRWCVC